MRLKYYYPNNNSICNQSGLVKVASPFYEMNGITYKQKLGHALVTVQCKLQQTLKPLKIMLNICYR